ncbi:MAG: hypothetical protein PVJ49_00410 [Acidobacteriota bacterium]
MIVGFALAVIVSTVIAAFEFRFLMPYWDMTSFWQVYFAAKDQGLLWQLLLSGVNTPDQRVFLLPWFTVFDRWLVRGNGVSMIAGNFLFVAAAMACVLWSRTRDTTLSSAHKLAVAALMTVPAFSAIHITLARPLFVVQYGQIACSVLAFAAAASLDGRIEHEDERSFLLPLSLIVAGNLFATLMWGSGLVGWGVTLAFALLRRWPARLIGSLFAAAAATLAAFYFASSAVPRTFSVRLTDLEPLVFIVHVVDYLANPAAIMLSGFFGPDTSHVVAQVVTVSGLVLMAAWMAAWVRSSRRPRSHFELLGLQILLFCLGVAMLTALARSHLGSDQAFSPRYSFRATWAWVVLIGIWVGDAPRKRLVPRLAIVAVVTIALLGPAQIRGIATYRGASEYLRPGYLALLAGVDDKAVTERIFPASTGLFRVAARLREERLAIFSSPPAGWLGRPLDDSFRTDPSPIAGTWEASEVPTDPYGIVVEGVCQPDDTRIEWFLIVDANGIVRGIGRPLRYRDTDSPSFRWRGYAAMRPAQNEYRVYVLDERSGAVRPLRQDAAAPGSD